MPAGRRGKRREPRFSVVTIVRNEANRLPRLLASLAEFRERGGEVVVLDTGSTMERQRSLARLAVASRSSRGNSTAASPRGRPEESTSLSP